MVLGEQPADAPAPVQAPGEFPGDGVRGIAFVVLTVLRENSY